MAVPKKPSVIRWRDAVIPGSLPVVSGVLTLIVFLADDLTTSAGDPLPSGIFGVHGVMVAMTLAFAAITFVWIRLRWRKLQAFEYLPGPYYALMIHRGDYKAAYDDAQIFEEFEAAFTGWGKVFDPKEIRNFADDALFWLWFEQGPIIERVRGKEIKMAGETIGGSRSMKVAFKNPTDDPSKTALQHEIGHVIQGHITGKWNEAEHHNRAKQHRLK